VNSHPFLLAQQSVYILLNVVGYVMWRQTNGFEKNLNAARRANWKLRLSRKRN